MSNFEWILENRVVMAKTGLELLLYLCYAIRDLNYKNMDWVVNGVLIRTTKLYIQGFWVNSLVHLA